ncbi:MAG: amidophosphoribosyltransferase [Dehalococcoidia bacterium]|nr:amidophosphoribosyltransferase [Dehalococcoidia bacterium]
MREKCGVFGVYAPGEDVARVTFFGLFSLQHRGQESAGIATSDGQRLHIYADMGLVTQIFREDVLEGLPGIAAIGHTRYSTTGSSVVGNAQPILVQGPAGPVAVAHNGNIVNAEMLRADLVEQGVEFTRSSDTEVIAQLLATATGVDWEGRFRVMMRRANGAYSLTVLTADAVYGVRDPNGIRPLCIGRLNGGYVIASESCALDHLGAELLREVEPGELVRLDASGLHTSFPLGEANRPRRALCLLEYIYFARPDSRLDGELLHPVRMRMGARLAREHPVEADLVIGVPDSATAAALGYAAESGIPYGEGLMKNRYVGRTFIQHDQRLREQGVQLKFNPLREVLEGKRLVVVDDSIVRGTTTPRVVAMLRRAGASEVHMRITSPPIMHPCFYGVDMATRGELIAANQSVEEIRRHVGADSLGYLSLEGTIGATRSTDGALCTACFSGRYPSEVPLELDKLVLEASPRRDRHDLPLVALRPAR